MACKDTKMLHKFTATACFCCLNVQVLSLKLYTGAKIVCVIKVSSILHYAPPKPMPSNKRSNSNMAYHSLGQIGGHFDISNPHVRYLSQYNLIEPGQLHHDTCACG